MPSRPILVALAALAATFLVLRGGGRTPLSTTWNAMMASNPKLPKVSLPVGRPARRPHDGISRGPGQLAISLASRRDRVLLSGIVILL